MKHPYIMHSALKSEAQYAGDDDKNCDKSFHKISVIEFYDAKLGRTLLTTLNIC